MDSQRGIEYPSTSVGLRDNWCYGEFPLPIINNNTLVFILNSI